MPLNFLRIISLIGSLIKLYFVFLGQHCNAIICEKKLQSKSNKFDKKKTNFHREHWQNSKKKNGKSDNVKSVTNEKLTRIKKKLKKMLQQHNHFLNEILV